MKVIGTVVVLALAAPLAFAHCDSLDGPVVQAARQALASRDVKLVLPWVPAEQESPVRDAFHRTIAIREIHPDVRAFADTWFFETVVRIHRLGEGAPYDGLKPAGFAAHPALSAADQALEKTDLSTLEKHLLESIRQDLHRRFEKAVDLRSRKGAGVAAGREYVAAYVDFIHYVERLHGGPAQNATTSEHVH